MRDLFSSMSTVVEEILIVDEWRGLYSESWKTAWRPNLPRATKNRGMICDDAFSHPAKFSRALIRQIYDHVVEEGWAMKGSSVIDPFGGVALGGFDAMRLGLNWTGCELEQKFVELGGKNIALWNERFSRMPNWGTARLIQGDSRKLAEVLRDDVDACISSPPYVLARQDTTKVPPTLGHIYGEDEQERIAALSDHRYGESAGQLGAMKEGDHSIVISSPPYARSLMPDMNDPEKYAASEARYREAHPERKRPKGAAMVYGNTKGNLGHMPEGKVDDAMAKALAVTSPPYNPPMSQDHNGTRGGKRGTTPSEKGAFVKYGNSDGQLEGMSMDGFSAAITSPPFEKGAEGNLRADKFKDPVAFATAMQAKDGKNGRHGVTLQARIEQLQKQNARTYGDNPENIGNQSGETFWSASRLILEQLHQVLAPNAHAVFVVKAFVRNKQIVDFPAQWAQLCEAVGFKLLHDHHALLTEHYGTQGGFESDKTLRVERKSFFRRLAESKGSPRIDHENVLCFEKV